MRLENGFRVPAPVERAWDVLLDLERVAPCMPGATLTSFDGEQFAGNVRVKVGPVVMTYTGKGRFAERQEQERKVIIEASGRDTKGAGTARATVTASLSPDGDSTQVTVLTDLSVTGRVAQFGRGMIADVGGRLVDQFAACLATTLAEAPAEEAAAEVAAAAEAAGVAQPAPAPVAAGGPAAPAVTPTAPAKAEPIDLLQATGVSAAARRAAPYLIGAAVLAAVAWVAWRVLH